MGGRRRDGCFLFVLAVATLAVGIISNTIHECNGVWGAHYAQWCTVLNALHVHDVLSQVFIYYTCHY